VKKGNGYVGFIGKVIENVVPWFGVLFTSMVSLCKSTMCFTIERPKPVPPSILERDLPVT